MKKFIFTLLASLCVTSVINVAMGQCVITAVPDPTAGYTPTQIANGDFHTRPSMVGYGNNRVPNGTNQGWNTTENGNNCFEYLCGATWIPSQLTANGNCMVEMNADNESALYQDLFTYGGDVIRWSLKHAVRYDPTNSPKTQAIRVEIGAPNYNDANIVYPHGVNNNIYTEINDITKSSYIKGEITNPSAGTYGYVGQLSDLNGLLLDKDTNRDAWYSATGVYVIPEGQSVTRFAFVSYGAVGSECASCGNFLDDITFSTLIGDVTATYGAGNSVIISGYWGDTDASKELVVEVGSQTFNVDMSGVRGQNFTVTIPGSCIGTNVTSVRFYHEDYPSAARTIEANLPITATAANVNVMYDGAAHGIAPVVTVPANGYTILYGSSYAGCNLESLNFINAGNYTVFYKVSADNYSTFIGSATVSISKAASSVVTAPTPGVNMEYLNSNISLLTAGGTAAGGNMVYALGTDANTAPASGYSTNIPKGKAWGNYYVWYKVQGDANHNDSDPGVVVASIAEPPTYAVTVSVRETGLGTVGINNNYNVSSTSIHAHDIVTINATPASGLSFVRWSDGNGVQKSTSNNYNATITEAIDFVADFGYNVSMTKIGNGTILMNYTDIDNVSQTTGEVTNNTQLFTHSESEVTLSATPDAHYHFKYWTNNLNDQKVTTNTFTFTPSATVSYAAVFAVDTHSVIVAANDPTIGKIFIKQDVLTEGFESGNMPNGLTSSGTGQWTVVSPENGQTGTYCVKNGNSGNHSSTSTLSVSINFVGEGSISFRSRISSENNYDWCRFLIDNIEKLKKSGTEGWTTYSYEVSAGDHTFAWSYSKDGSVSSNDDAFYVDDIVIKDFASASTEPYRYTYGQTCDILAVPEEYCYLNNWTDENHNVVGTTASKSFTVSGNTTLTANFAVNSYTIAATANPTAGGSITGADSYNHNATCTLTATANEGYSFVNWTEGGNVVSTNASYTFTVTSARTLVANFQLNSYEIAATVTPTAGGSVTGAGNYNHFVSCTLTATANEGYHFVNWTKGGTQVSANPSYIFTVADAGDYVANFQLNSYTIAATANPTAGGSITGAGNYNHGTEVTLTATPAMDYHFVNWTKEGESEPVSTDATYIFTATASGQYTATFAIDEYRIDSIPLTWQVKIDGGNPFFPTPYVTENPTVADTMGYVMIPVGSEFFIIPSENQKNLVSKLELTILGSGTSADPYLISSVEDWNYLADKVNSGTNYAGKYFLQTADIGTTQDPVTRMVGVYSGTESERRPFSGTFDGQGHTLTVDYSSNSYYTRTAPFSYVNAATIRNLIVTGNCGTPERSAGIVGECNSLTNVINCISSVTISGGPCIGGISIGGHYHIEGCLFNGTINATEESGGLVGWGENDTEISNCLFAPQDGSSIIGGTLYRTGSGGVTITNCYYTTALGDVQGKQARSITAGTDVTISDLGDATATYNVSGITAYAHGIKYNEVYYAGNGDAVSLTLSHAEAPAGFFFSQYTVTGGGTLNTPLTNNSTLTMTDANQTINAQWTSQTFEYTGDVQTFTVPATGYYTLACYGAQGGRFVNADGLGGLGGISQITYYLTAGTVLYVYVGGQGEEINSVETDSDTEGGDGGWNGGGKGGTGARWHNEGILYRGGSGGGGATHIATNAIGPITVSTDFTANHAGLLLIAGGGGGGTGWGIGGKGGGAAGENGSSNYIASWSIVWNNGTYSCGRDGEVSSTGSYSCCGCGGGGGGFQGGNTWHVTSSTAEYESYSGAGGSSWGETTNGKGYSTTTGGATSGGNGKAVITWYGTTYPSE